MRILTTLIFLAILSTGNAQVEGASYDDLCDGCCGLKLDFYSSGNVITDQGGAVRFLGSGTWSFENDTLKVFMDNESRRFESYVIEDSLTLKNVDGTYGVRLKKTSMRGENGIYVNYDYEGKSLVSMKMYRNNILVSWREYDGKKVNEKVFSDLGIMESQGMWKRGKKTGMWSYYNEDGVLIETREH